MRPETTDNNDPPPLGLGSTHLIHIILNPTSGSGRALQAWSRAEPHLAAVGQPITVHRTTARGSASGIAAELAHADTGDVVVAVGGDGTVHEVANGLLRGGAGHPEPALAVLAVGTGNDTARQLSFGADPAVLARMLAGGATRRIDAGHLSWPGGEEWFVNIASVGFTAASVQLADVRSKRFGVVNYVHAAVLAILAHGDYAVRIGVDGAEPELQRIGTAVVANGAWFGAGMHVAPWARVDDGLLDLLTVQGAGRLRLLGLLAGVFGGWHLRSSAVRVSRVKSLRLEWEEELPVEAEGELVPARSPLDLTVHPGALRVLAGDG